MISNIQDQVAEWILDSREGVTGLAVAATLEVLPPPQLIDLASQRLSLGFEEALTLTLATMSPDVQYLDILDGARNASSQTLSKAEAAHVMFMKVADWVESGELEPIYACHWVNGVIRPQFHDESLLWFMSLSDEAEELTSTAERDALARQIMTTFDLVRQGMLSRPENRR